jgi:dihydrofolate reductase
MIVALVAARSENNVIGNGGEIPWHLPGDLEFFKELTTGHTIIMGRKTFETLPRPLPNRRTIVLTRDRTYRPAGVEVTHSLETALDLADPEEREEVFVVGGEEVYRIALPYARRMYLTRVHTIAPGDVFFPEFPADEWEHTQTARHEADDQHEFDYTFEVWERRE